MRLARPFLLLAFFGSGASALLYQALWQRILSLHAGMDLFSVTVVVAAFMAGLGFGNLLGGSAADRLSPRRAVALYGVAELAIGAFGLVSPRLLYHWYPSFSPHLTSTAAAFGFHFALLCLPTLLMGATLPLLTRALAKDTSIAQDVGGLYGVNTVGAALGGLLTSGAWVLSYGGLEPIVYGAAGLNAVAGLGALALSLTLSPTPPPERQPLSATGGLPMRWLVIYGLTGFIALGLEIAWFRYLNVVMSSNTYTFSRLLTVYLIGVGLGSLLGARLLRRIKDAEATFFWLQLATGASALLGPVAITHFIGAAGFPALSQEIKERWLPLGTLLAPTLLMGMSFTVIQAVVSKRLERVGRSTGALLFANTVGCVLGTLLTGFVLLDRLGTPATLRLLAGASAAFGVIAALRLTRGRAAGVGLVGATVGGLMLSLPSGAHFWRLLHNGQGKEFSVTEDRSCVTALVKDRPEEHSLYISGERQNGIPFDDFHIRLGWMPPLFHPNPKRVLVIGLGAGSTGYGLTADPRVERIDLVEICGSERPLLERLGQQGYPELSLLFSDPRLHFTVRDGRKFLLEAKEPFDVIITDTLLPSSTHSGSLYSVEFYELVRSRLAPGGVFAQWKATDRTVNTAASVFGSVVLLSDPVGGPVFFLASQEPVAIDTSVLKERLAATRKDGLRPGQLEALARFAEQPVVQPVPRPEVVDFNRDLFPKDEYRAW